MATYQQRESGNWKVTIYTGKDPSTGKYKRISRTFPTKEEAELWAAKKTVDKHEGIPINPEEYLVSDYLKQWLKDYVEVNLSPTTYDDYRTTITGHIIPALGQVKLTELRPDHIQNYQSEKLKNGRKDGKGGLSKRTVQKHHRILSKALKQATLLNLIKSNPCNPVAAPSPDKREIETLTTKQVNKLQNIVKGTKIYEIVMTAIFTGMRRGEILGLGWDGVDFNRKKIYVKQVLVKKKGQGTVLKTYPKNKSSRRAIEISNKLINMLKKLKWQQKKNKNFYGEDYNHKDDLVFCFDDGSYIHPGRPGKILKRLLKGTGLEGYTLHQLRHTHATLMLENGVKDKVVAERLGHSTTRTTKDIYAHATETMQKEAVDIFDEAVK